MNATDPKTQNTSALTVEIRDQRGQIVLSCPFGDTAKDGIAHWHTIVKKPGEGPMDTLRKHLAGALAGPSVLDLIDPLETAVDKARGMIDLLCDRLDATSRIAYETTSTGGESLIAADVKEELYNTFTAVWHRAAAIRQETYLTKLPPSAEQAAA